MGSSLPRQPWASRPRPPRRQEPGRGHQAPPAPVALAQGPRGGCWAAPPAWPQPQAATPGPPVMDGPALPRCPLCRSDCHAGRPGGGAGAGSWPPLRHLPATRPLRGGGCGAGVKEAGETLEVRGQREAGEGAVGAEEAGPGGHTTWGGHSPEHAPHRPWAPPGCHLPGPPPCSVAWSPRWSWGGPTVGAPRGLHLKACDSPAVVSAPPPPSSVA